MSRRWLLCLLTLLLSPCLHAASVWKVTHGNQTLYLGGTLHLLSATDYPLPSAFDKAYQQSQTLVFETDLAAASTLEFQQKAMQAMTYTDGRTIKDELSQDTLKALTDHLSARNLPLLNFLSFKPSMMSLTLSLIEMQRAGLTSEGVDQFYANKATADNKPQLWLETPEQQLAFLASMGADDADGLIRYTLRDLKSLPQMLDQLKVVWRNGDMQGMTELSITPFKKDYPQVYEDLLVTRNRNWLPQIVDMLGTPETEFVLVGAMHLAGADSVLGALQAKGYQVEQLD